MIARLRPLLLLVAFALACASSSAIARPKRGQACDAKGRCAKGLTCKRYYGVAGPAGGEMTSCEIPCQADKDCPKKERCITIADGPGQVCRLPTDH